MPTAEQSRFVALAHQLANKYGKPLTKDFKSDFGYYIAHADDAAETLTNLPKAKSLGRIAVHVIELDYCEITTSLSMLNESSGVMPYDATTGGRLMGQFSIGAVWKTDKSDLIWMAGGIYTSQTAAWHGINYDIGDTLDLGAEIEALNYFSRFDRGLFQREVTGTERDNLNDDELRTVSAYLQKGIGILDNDSAEN